MKFHVGPAFYTVLFFSCDLRRIWVTIQLDKITVEKTSTSHSSVGIFVQAWPAEDPKLNKGEPVEWRHL